MPDSLITSRTRRLTTRFESLGPKSNVDHWWLANVGLAGMVGGFVMAPHVGPKSAPVTATGGVLFTLGAFCFAYNMWTTFNAADARVRERAKGLSLPTID